MGMSGLDIYKLLPKTNCRECGFSTCLAFAMQLAKKAIETSKCPYLSEEAKKILESASQPPIRLITIGRDDYELKIGNETVMFRHEEKFHHPCGIGCILKDGLTLQQNIQNLERLQSIRLERVGQLLKLNLVAIKQTKDTKTFVKTVEEISRRSQLGLVLMAKDISGLQEALKITADKKPLIYPLFEADEKLADLAKRYLCPVVVLASDLEGLSKRVAEFNNRGIADIVLDSGKKTLVGKLWDLTQARRLALKRHSRSLGYPFITVIDEEEPYEKVLSAAALILKYSGIILMDELRIEEALVLLTVRQNIYTDPQKPLQIEPKLYSVGKTTKTSPLLVTTNFSLTYYTVLGEVEASKVPSYILSVDTEGMSVLTAWAAEKFNAQKIAQAIQKNAISDVIDNKQVNIPGHVAMMSGELE